MSILKRHPGFVAANLSFRRNVLDTFAHIPAVTEALGSHAAALAITAPRVLTARYSASEVTYDEGGTEAFRRARLEDLTHLTLVPSGNLAAQLRHLRQDKKAVKALFRVMPFLFDSSGGARFTAWDDSARANIAASITQSTPPDWENLYFDFLKEHITPLIEAVSKDDGMNEIRALYQSTRNQFFERDVRAAIRPTHGAGGSNAVRTLSIESVPAAVAVARGSYGGDCSILTVPFFPLSKDVNVHFIRKSRDLTAKPDGYVLSVMVEVGAHGQRRRIPYVLTVNGASLTEGDVRVAIDLVMRSAGASEVAFPDWSRAGALVNWDASKKAMVHARGTAATVTLPQGWSVLDAYHGQNNQTGYTNYYRREAIENALVGEFAAGVHFQGEVESTQQSLPSYLRPEGIAEIPKMERAIVAHQALQDGTGGASLRRQLLGILNLEEADVEAIAPLTAVSPEQGLTLSQYRLLESRFGFGLREILAFEARTRAKILATLYGESPALLTEHGGRANAKVRQTLAAYYGRGRFKPIIEMIWDASDLSDARVVGLLRESLAALGSPEIETVTAFAGLARSTSIEERLAEAVCDSLSQSLVTDFALGRALGVGLTHGSEAVRAFASRLLNHAASGGVRPVQQAFREIWAVSTTAGISFEEAAMRWLSQESGTAAAKAQFLLCHFGSRVYALYLAAIPTGQVAAVNSALDQTSTVRLYAKAAQDRGHDMSIFDGVKAEAYLLITPEPLTHGTPVEFTMGSPATEQGRNTDEQQHRVRLTSEFAMQATGVTQLQYYLLTGLNPSNFKGEEQSEGDHIILNGVHINKDHPVEQVSHNDVIAYLRLMNEKAGCELYRLPTEAEREYASRGGADTRFFWGDDEADIDQYAWYYKNSNNRTHRVAAKRPNAYGFYDLAGHLWEWQQDLYSSNYGLTSEQIATTTQDPMYSIEGSSRVLRGGCWISHARYVRSARRHFVLPGDRYADLGFRVVRFVRACQ
jgi:formylglycine-generating enzyme required for sulfatase activity